MSASCICRVLLPPDAPLISRFTSTLGPIYMNSLPCTILADEAKYITGAQIPVDLGNLIR